MLYKPHHVPSFQFWIVRTIVVLNLDISQLDRNELCHWHFNWFCLNSWYFYVCCTRFSYLFSLQGDQNTNVGYLASAAGSHVSCKAGFLSLRTCFKLMLAVIITVNKPIFSKPTDEVSFQY